MKREQLCLLFGSLEKRWDVYIAREAFCFLWGGAGRGSESRETLAAKKKTYSRKERWALSRRASDMGVIYPMAVLSPGPETKQSNPKRFLSPCREGRRKRLAFSVSSAHTGTEAGPSCSFS